ncbi:unnamed protein product [Mytilus coruscus]|uniref:Uncharacterized protein n=1 Tax=Mytilus coruscus TaxID=42192 RepID=A0A6J8EB61_MYTCO|nr:unnamed protein product [Mytilus coruscus]
MMIPCIRSLKETNQEATAENYFRFYEEFLAHNSKQAFLHLQILSSSSLSKWDSIPEQIFQDEIRLADVVDSILMTPKIIKTVAVKNYREQWFMCVPVFSSRAEFWLTATHDRLHYEKTNVLSLLRPITRALNENDYNSALSTLKRLVFTTTVVSMGLNLLSVTQIIHYKPPRSVTNKPPRSVTNKPPRSVTNKPPRSVTNKPPRSVTNKPPRSVTNNFQELIELKGEVK